MTLNPFDPKAALLANHAQHVVLIHFPIALFLSGVLFDFLGRWTNKPALRVTAYFNLLLAAISTIPTVATGLLAWQWALAGQKLKGILLMHLLFGCLSTVFIWIVWLLHRAARRSEGADPPPFTLLVESVAVLVVALTGHLGGFLSGVNVTN